jgi:hypothetical protein
MAGERLKKLALASRLSCCCARAANMGRLASNYEAKGLMIVESIEAHRSVTDLEDEQFTLEQSTHVRSTYRRALRL